MTTLMQASRQWASRPSDERFLSLLELQETVEAARNNSRDGVIANRQITVQPAEDNPTSGIAIVGPKGEPALPTHWSFGQLAQLGGAPAGYLRSLPAPLAADCVNYGLQVKRDIEEIGVLLTKTETGTGVELRAATGPRYGRVWNADVVRALVERFGDGLSGDFRVPGEFGKEVQVTKENTTIYGSDRDMFVFLADEKNRINVPNRRNGQSGSMARGFFVWNSEVGAQSIGAAFFLFDYVCCNRIVWGAEGFKEIRLRHTVSAPDKWLEEVAPVLVEYSNASAMPIEMTIKAAQERRIEADVEKFLANRFTRSQAMQIMVAHEREENRPIETVWDAVTGATAYARNIAHQDTRVAIERQAGKILDMAA